MAIVITPNGQYVDDQTGMPVDPRLLNELLDPRSSARQGEVMGGANLDPGSVVREGEANLDPRSVAREGEDVVMERMFPGSGLDPRSVAREGERMTPRALDPGSVVRGGEMARENIPSDLDMGMDSEMRAEDLSDVDKVRMLIDMGLSPKEAMEAIGREKAMGVRPEEFGATIPSEGMGALGGVPTGAMMPATMSAPMPTPRGSTNMGMPEDAIMAQRMNQVDTTGLSPEQMNMLRMGIDPFAEGMVR